MNASRPGSPYMYIAIEEIVFDRTINLYQALQFKNNTDTEEKRPAQNNVKQDILLQLRYDG